MEIVFSYDGYVAFDAKYPDNFDMKSTIDLAKVDKLGADHTPDYNTYGNLMPELRKRTTDDYYKKVELVQTAARRHSQNVFPPYEFFMAETITEDWLSMVDWHKEHSTRDHSLHQPLTTYIIQVLLGCGISKKSILLPNGKFLLDFCAELMLEGEGLEYIRSYFPNECDQFKAMNREDKLMWAKNVFYETAVMSALFHDMGYPWQYLGRLYKHVSVAELDSILCFESNGAEMQKYLSNHLLSVPYYGYKRFTSLQPQNDFGNNISELMQMSFTQTHGVPGAVSFLKLNEKTRKQCNPGSLMSASCNLILEWAAVGIMMHDVAGLYKKKGYKCFRLNFDTDPLSCLIAMADVLEEFERPSAIFCKDDGAAQLHVNLKYNFSCKSTSLLFDKNEMQVKDIYQELPKALAKKHREDELRDYFNLDNGFVNLSSWGITSFRPIS